MIDKLLIGPVPLPAASLHHIVSFY